MKRYSLRTRTTANRFVTLLILLVIVSWTGAVPAQPLASPGTVHALFDLAKPTTGPFPSDWFTTSNSDNNTGRQVNLPLPDCSARRSDCDDLNVINRLDGFDLQPRLSIPFDGPIDPKSVTSKTVFLISLGSTFDGDDHSGHVVGINRVVWDTFTNTLHVESDALLDQHTRYALIVTRGVRDQDGNPVDASEEFRQFRQRVREGYKHALLEAIHAARRVGFQELDIATASVFTTQSATAIMEKIRDQIKAATPAQADFNLGPGGTRTVFPLEAVTSVTWLRQTRDNPPGFALPLQLDLQLLRMIPGAVRQIAFGKYVSPDYEVHPGEFIPPITTRTGIPSVQGQNEVYFDLYLPSGPKPVNGWPVAIFGHGATGNRHLAFHLAAILASHGIATVSINAVGHGFGPLGTLTVTPTVGEPVTFPSGGRGMAHAGDHTISAIEGFAAAPPQTIVFWTDGIRQTVADLMQLVRVIEVGMDVSGHGSQDLDPFRIYYVGVSLGGIYGAPFLAVEPSVRAGVLNVAAAGNLGNKGLTPGPRSGLGQMLASRVPSLINAPGIMTMDGVNVSPPHFNNNMPLRDGLPLAVRLADGTSQVIQSPVVNTVAGASEIQQALKNLEWVGQAGSAAAYAFHFRRSPLPGMPAKSVLLQFGRGDQTGGNPNHSAIVRAGDLADRTTFYRHDLAFAEDPTLPKNPHRFILFIGPTLQRAIARGFQQQIAHFFASDGTEVIHPEPAHLFEVPIVLPLPEDLGFIP